MKKYIYGFVAAALTLSMGGIPAVAVHAQETDVSENVSESVSTSNATGASSTEREEHMNGYGMGHTRVRARVNFEHASTRAQMERARELIREKHANEMKRKHKDGKVSGLSRREVGEKMRDRTAHRVKRIKKQIRHRMKHIGGVFENRIKIELEGTTTPVHSLVELRRAIRARRVKLQERIASTSPRFQKILEGVAPMRVAVHALLASRDLLGKGIGQKVSDIARQVDDSVATTTNVEAQIQSRGFWKNLFFGGDTKAAGVIKQQVEQNQARIQSLTKFVSEANTTGDVKKALGDQVQAMKDEQVRLQKIAQRQAGLWGIFSWRF